MARRSWSRSSSRRPLMTCTPFVLCLLLILAAIAAPAAAQEDLRVLPEKPGSPAPADMMEAYLKPLAFAALDRREAAWERVTTSEQLAAYQQRLRQFFLEQLGPFP